ncbi:non-specific serine/threonine protein kinase [Trifolium repens]|nr:non-specific serine/threonine protein kinase [Trifolium repens]
MKKPPSSSSFNTHFTAVTIIIIIFFYLSSSSNALGSGTTLSVTDSPATVCGITSGQSKQTIQCYRQGKIFPILPNVSFSSISGGRSYFCGLRSGNYSLHCWDTLSSFQSKRLYVNDSVLLENLSVGDSQVCATVVGTGAVRCWRTNDDFEPSGSDRFGLISSGSNFSCGILKNGSKVRCWGEKVIAERLQNEFGNISMLSIVAGGSHVCGLNSTGFLVCKGSNSSGQIDVPKGGAFEYGELSLGDEHGCAIRRKNGSVICWGGKGKFLVNFIESVSFELIVSASNFTCGLTTTNFSVICWGPGWSIGSNGSESDVPLSRILPGPCVQSSCSECGIYPDSQSLCSSTSHHICSRIMRRQRSGPSTKHQERAEEFSLSELIAATNHFSLQNKIGAGSFGIVYRGKLFDGREVAIKRGETGKRAIFRNDEDEGNPSSLVDFAVPAILAGELVKILDSRVGLPEAESNESEAVELMAYTAVHCVNLEGKDRPTMADIVANLERALLICEGGSNNEIESISSVTISIVSD